MKKDKVLENQAAFWIEVIQNQIYSDIVRYVGDSRVKQTELAKRLGVTNGYVSQILKGDNINFTIESLVKICLVIGRVPVIELRDINEFEPTELPISKSELINFNSKKTKKIVEEFVNVIKNPSVNTKAAEIIYKNANSRDSFIRIEGEVHKIIPVQSDNRHTTKRLVTISVSPRNKRPRK